ncbi:MAG: hypothetical protein P4M13_06610 [Alphaproteobacteria bacterium]|nr:hypothetical protein [Alphaproteobacteria bacterium]
MVARHTGKGRLDSNAGIAIGPILFIIAILAILAAAIAAGSGSFTAGTGTESNRTKSTALIQIGENLKIGMDRITMASGMDPTTVNTLVTDTTDANALFSPAGGGISPPSTGMANNPAVDKWYFVQGTIPGLGSGGSNNDVVAVIAVPEGVCAEVNNRVTGVGSVPAPLALGNFVANELSAAAWPTAAAGAAYPSTSSPGVDLAGVTVGCVNNNSVSSLVSATASPTTQYFFYQILAIQ